MIADSRWLRSPAARRFAGSSRSHTAGCVWLLLPLLLALPLADRLAAAEQSIDDQAAAQALQAIPKTDWFDKEKGGYKRPAVGVEADNPLRTEGWTRKAGNRKPWSWDWLDWRPNWSFTGLASDWISTVVLSVLGVVLTTAIVLLTYYALRDYFPAVGARTQKQTRVEIDPAKIADLPFEVQGNATDPLGIAYAFRAAGDYDRAVIYLFGYMLLALDQRRHIHLQKGKTNRMYLAELKATPALKQLVAPVVMAFEESFFGRQSIGKEQLIELMDLLPKFHQLIDLPEQPLARRAAAEAVAT